MESIDLIRILQVVFGIGLVIFVHEAGHFVAARMCGVRAEVFSLGFGPRMWGFRRGGTLYQIAWLPLGGYVRMAGEFRESGEQPKSDELQAKSVGQRFFIYSGGVIMNVVFALVVFPMVLASGVPVLRPLIASPQKGMPAWHAGMEAGTEILSVDGDEVYDFFHIPNEVALAEPGPVEFVVLRPGATEPSTIHITPVYSDVGGFRQIGVRPGVDPTLALRVDPDGPAAAAGLIEGDVLLGVEEAPQQLSPVAQFQRALATGEPVTLRVQRGDQIERLSITPTALTTERLLFGVEPLQNRIEDLRPNRWLERMGFIRGERLVAVDGNAIVRPHDLGRALRASAPADGSLTLVFRPSDSSPATRTVTLPDRPNADEIAALEEDLYLSYNRDSTVAHASEGRAALAAGLVSGDRILRVGDVNVSGWKEVLKATQKLADKGEPVEFAVQRSTQDAIVKQPVILSITPTPATQKDYGFGLGRAQGVYKTDSVSESIGAGAQASWRFLTDAWLTLKKMLLREVSAENLGGIITIGAVSYDWASQGWAKLFFFLCMLSINLAFLNVLPIPVLDGGHLFFCIVEAIKGSPVSERTLGYSQVVGIVLILTLTVYVTYQDVLRVLPGIR